MTTNVLARKERRTVVVSAAVSDVGRVPGIPVDPVGVVLTWTDDGSGWVLGDVQIRGWGLDKYRNIYDLLHYSCSYQPGELPDWLMNLIEGEWPKSLEEEIKDGDITVNHARRRMGLKPYQGLA